MAGNGTFIQLPSDVTNPMELRRFLDKLIEQVDIAFGNRGGTGFSTTASLNEVITTVNSTVPRVDDIESDIIDINSSIDTIKDGLLTTKVTADSTLDSSTRLTMCDATSGDLNITLPNPANVYKNSRSKEIAISKIDSTSNIVNILPSGTEVIISLASVSLVQESEIINLVTDGINWYLGA